MNLMSDTCDLKALALEKVSKQKAGMISGSECSDKGGWFDLQ